MEKPGIIKNDPWLEPFESVIKARIYRMQDKEKELRGESGSLKEFSSGHLYFGLHASDTGWVFREWAPNAKKIYLVGDFSDWKELSEWELKPTLNGNWELEIPSAAMKHGNLYRLSIYWEGGQGSRIPAWANRVIQDPESLIFNAQVWSPETEYKWKITGKMLILPRP